MSGQDFVILDGSKGWKQRIAFYQEDKYFCDFGFSGLGNCLRATLLETKNHLNSLKKGRNRL